MSTRSRYVDAVHNPRQCQDDDVTPPWEARHPLLLESIQCRQRARTAARAPPAAGWEAEKIGFRRVGDGALLAANRMPIIRHHKTSSKPTTEWNRSRRCGSAWRCRARTHPTDAARWRWLFRSKRIPTSPVAVPKDRDQSEFQDTSRCPPCCAKRISNPRTDRHGIASPCRTPNRPRERKRPVLAKVSAQRRTPATRRRHLQCWHCKRWTNT